jgi:hypothetical protein
MRLPSGRKYSDFTLFPLKPLNVSLFFAVKSNSNCASADRRVQAAALRRPEGHRGGGGGGGRAEARDDASHRQEDQGEGPRKVFAFSPLW